MAKKDVMKQISESMEVTLTDRLIDKIAPMVNDPESIIENGITILEIVQMAERCLKGMFRRYEILQKAYSEFEDISFISEHAERAMDKSAELFFVLERIYSICKEDGVFDVLQVNELSRIAFMFNNIDVMIYKISMSSKGLENYFSGSFGKLLKHYQSVQPQRRNKKGLEIELDDSDVKLITTTKKDRDTLGI